MPPVFMRQSSVASPAWSKTHFSGGKPYFFYDLEHLRQYRLSLGSQSDGGMQDDRHIVGFGDLQMLAEELLLELSTGVQADLPQGHGPVGLKEVGQPLQALLGVRVVDSEEGDGEGGEELEAQGLGRGRLHAQEALPHEEHAVCVFASQIHVGAGDDGRLHAHHDQFLQLFVLDHVGVQVGVYEAHARSSVRRSA